MTPEAAVLIVGLGIVIALLIAVVMTLREVRDSIDACRVMVSDAVGVPPQTDLIDLRGAPQSGTVDIPRAYRELVADDDERAELER